MGAQKDTATAQGFLRVRIRAERMARLAENFVSGSVARPELRANSFANAGTRNVLKHTTNYPKRPRTHYELTKLPQTTLRTSQTAIALPVSTFGISTTRSARAARPPLRERELGAGENRTGNKSAVWAF